MSEAEPADQPGPDDPAAEHREEASPADGPEGAPPDDSLSDASPDDALADDTSDVETPATKTAASSAARLSVLRVLIALVIVVAMVAGGARLAARAIEPEPFQSEPWFAPYVDVTLTPTLDFQEPTANPNKRVALAFVVAAPKDACAPSWGASYTLDQAALQLDLDRRIARQRERGGEVIVSFGGVANDELARSCTDPTALAAAYRSVINRYQLTTIDLDLEGASLDEAASARRAAAIAKVQTEARGSGRGLDVWLTLPMAPNGLGADGVATVDAMLKARVDIAGVNVMTMNYGNGRPAGTDLVTASLNGVDATARQVTASYKRAGLTITPTAVYAKIGVTPMIGQNDSPDDRLTVADARRLFDDSRTRGVGRFSMWSLNRDVACADGSESTIAKNTCSGVEQVPFEFSSIFGAVSTRPASAGTAGSVPESQGRLSDDKTPVAGPYPEWRQRREYNQGAKVVWRGQVYEAKWWNKATQPDAPVEHEWDSPWRLIGPVLDHETPTTTIPAGTYPEWMSKTVYQPGDRVQRNGVGYRAKWNTMGNDPAADVDNDWETPWEQVPAPAEGTPVPTTATTVAPTSSTTTTAPVVGSSDPTTTKPAVAPASTTTTVAPPAH